MNPINYDQINEQEEIPALTITFSADKNKRYCRLEHEINPLHFDAEYARKLGYKDIVIAGIFTASFFPKIITDWLGNIVSIERVSVKFINPAYLNDVVTYKGKVLRKFTEKGMKKIDCNTWSENSGHEKLAEARVIAAFK
ncbi:MAG: MaoC family dehydratase [Candidatus Helarchaeota archaeon]